MTLVDGSAVQRGCMCDSHVPRPDGRERDCAMPCWQRIGMTETPCCSDCAPLPRVEPQGEDGP